LFDEEAGSTERDQREDPKTITAERVSNYWTLLLELGRGRGELHYERRKRSHVFQKRELNILPQRRSELRGGWCSVQERPKHGITKAEGVRKEALFLQNRPERKKGDCPRAYKAP